MLQTFPPNLDVAEYIRHQKIEIHFQPIISVRRKSVVGIEALSRGVSDDGVLISPRHLFDAAAVQNLSFELDNLCRESALQAFVPIHKNNPNLILFLNLHASAFDQGAHAMFGLTSRMGIDSRNVALEILESEFDDMRGLQNSVDEYKKCGFLVAMDDIGAGHSNLDRIVRIKPDVLKADISLVRDLHLEYHKQEVFKSLVHLSEKIGGWIISEGVETEDEAVMALRLGGDIVQGFYFADPHKIEDNKINFKQKSLEQVGARFKKLVLAKIETDQHQRETRTAIMRCAVEKLGNVSSAKFEIELEELISAYPLVESACVLDETGLQFSETVVGGHRMQPQKTVIYQPPPAGADHSLKEYFYALKETRLEIFETNPYVPLPCGELCITTSTFFKDKNDLTFILCLHLNAEAIKTFV